MNIEKEVITAEPSDFVGKLEVGKQETLFLEKIQLQINETFGLGFLRGYASQMLDFVQKEVSPKELLEAIQENGVDNFVVFLVGWFLEENNEGWFLTLDEIEDNEYSFSDLVGDCSDRFVLDEIKKLEDFFALSKDDLINDFVIPNYKVGKASHLWLEELTERALNKAIDKHFKMLNHFNEVFFHLLDDFTDGDHVSIFEYFLAQQDEVLKEQELRCSTSLMSREQWTQAILLEEQTFDDY